MRVWDRIVEADRRVRRAAVRLLVQGVTVERIALSAAVGVVAGVFPIVGMTTLLSFVAAVGLRLNMIVVQFFNGICYPLQLALILPLIRLGRHLFASDPSATPASRILELMQTDRGAALGELWSVTWQAVAAWSLLAPLLTGVLYLVLMPVVKRLRPETLRAGGLIPEPPA